MREFAGNSAVSKMLLLFPLWAWLLDDFPRGRFDLPKGALVDKAIARLGNHLITARVLSGGFQRTTKSLSELG
jgi:hypothetical protein